jgi:hypothetical protein
MNKDNVLNVLEESEEKRERFLAAWKRGVDFLGSHLFGPGTTAPPSGRTAAAAGAGRGGVRRGKRG